MRAKFFFFSTAALFCAMSVARAQTPNASQQMQSVEQRRQLEQSAQSMIASNAVPELYAGESSDVGPQSVLRIKPRRTWLEAGADAQYFYSDNIFLANNGKVDGDVLVSTVSAALAPSAFTVGDGQLSPRVGIQEQWFNYGLYSSKQVSVYDFSTGTFKNASLSDFDFNVLSVFGDVSWSRQNWTFTLGGNYNRFADSTDYNDGFYREYVPRWAVRHDFVLGENQMFSLGYEGDYRLTETPGTPPGTGGDFNDRTDHALFAVGSWRLCRHAILQPSYRFQYTHFTATARNDYLNSFGLTLYCPLTQNVTLRTYVSYDKFYTDGFYANNYNKFDGGGGLNLAVRF